MSIRRKVRSVEVIFRDLEQKIEAFKQDTQIHCVAGCGFCCKKPDIEATVIEFLPLAFHYFLNDKAEERLAYLKNNPQSVCHLFHEGSVPGAGFCTLYPYRGVICRLFGFSARKDKYDNPEYSTCRKIKEAMPEKYIDAYLAVKSGLKIPLMTDYYQRLNHVDFELARKMYPVNIAIQKAIEVVLSYYTYRRFRTIPAKKSQNKGTMPNPGFSQDLISDPQ